MTILRIFLLLLLFCGVTSASEFTTDPETCLALNIYHESRSEAPIGQMAVGLVTLNRVVDRGFPNEVCKVVWQHRQFSWTHDGKSDQPKEKLHWKKAQELAKRLYTTYFEFVDDYGGAMDYTDGAIFYYNPSLVDPVWRRDVHIIKTIGNHTFARRK